jgi:uncharacterized membrane protein
MACFGLADFIYKRAADAGVRPHQFIFAQAAIFTPVAILIAFATGTLVWTPPMLWGALAGLFTFVGSYSFSRSLIGGVVSINAPLFRLNFMVTAALAFIFLDEQLTLAKVVGLVAALAAAWLLVGGGAPADALANARARRSVLLALAATVTYGCANFCQKLGLMQGVAPVTMLVAQAGVFLPITLIAVLMLDRRVAVPARTWRYGCVTAICLLSGFLALFGALLGGEVSVVVPIAQMGFIVTAALGMMLLGERLTLRRTSGLIAAAAALVTLAL